MTRNQTPQQSLLTLRAAVVFLIGIVAAVGVGALTYLSSNSLAASVLAGSTAFGASVTFAHSIID
ncbi:hypothetical protein ACWEQN_40000 [Streptomyces sp. NPDC004129]